jgi:serine/threonine protein kinase
LNALAVVHQKGFLHRDLKPANAMISNDGVLKLGDFGCATLVKEQYSVEGFSKWYTAPEILFGSRSYTWEIDMWSFGCVLGELINGLPLFPG